MPRVELPIEPNERRRQWQLYLPASDIELLWPQIRSAVIPQMAELADIRYVTAKFQSRGGRSTYIRYHPDDVHQVASSLAEDRIAIPAAWRPDTPEGAQAERLHQQRSKQQAWIGPLFLLALFVVLLAVLWTVALLLK
jgi:hypothetical protein